MRREGFELGISRPRVLFGEDENGKKTEPYETVIIDVDEEYSGTVVEKMDHAQGRDDRHAPVGRRQDPHHLLARPSRGMIGYHGEFLSDTRGTGIMNRLFEKYGPHKGKIEGRKNGVLISNGSGEANSYALGPLEERGILFVGHGEALYEGMIIGENAKPDDLEVNPMKAKQLTNFRATGGKDDAIRLTPPKKHDAGAGDRLYRRRRDGRGDAEVDPAAQALPRSARAQAGQPGEAGGVTERLIARATIRPTQAARPASLTRGPTARLCRVAPYRPGTTATPSPARSDAACRRAAAR